MSNILLDLIWVQTVCVGYQQTAKVAASKERVNGQGMEEDFILVRAPHDKDYGQRSEELVDRQLIIRVY